MDQKDIRTGFFGKLATQGDFVSRRLSPAFITEWDGWLQTGLKHSRARLGLGWQKVYLCSPIWHFALAGGVCGELGWSGVLMPSVDRVGRYFPLTVACGGQDVPIVARLRGDPGWYAEVERLGLSSLEDGFSLEHFDQALSGLPAPSRLSPLMPEPARRNVACTLWLQWQEHKHLNEIVDLWAAQLLCATEGQSLAGHSLFWTDGSSHLPPTLLVCPGLPTAQMFVDMLAGRRANVA